MDGRINICIFVLVYAPAGRTLTDPKTTCKTCTPQQVTELTCCNCEKTKGLTHFAKNQRKNPDAARCMKCVQRGLGAGSGDEFSDGDDDTDQDDSERELVWLPTHSLARGFRGH